MKSVSTDDQPNLQRRFAIRVSWLLAASGAYFHIASLGMHPAKGYLCYPWVMLWLLAAVCLNGIRSWQLRTALFVGVLFIQLPGSGMRAAWTYLMRHEGVAYNRSRFCEDLNEKLPPNARLLVSPEFVFEFEILGRQPINASLVPIYNDVLGYKFDYLIAGRQVLDEQIPEELNCKFQWDMGNPDDPLACYARVYAITPKTPQKINWPRTN